MGIIQQTQAPLVAARVPGAGWLRGRTRRRRAAFPRLAYGEILLDTDTTLSGVGIKTYVACAYM